MLNAQSTTFFTNAKYSSPKHDHNWSSAYAICSDSHSTGSTRPDCNWTMKFCSQWTCHMELSATSTTVTGPGRKHLQAGIEDAPVLDRLVPLRHHYSGAAYYIYIFKLTY